MARWLATDPAVLLLNDPTRGVDLGAKRDLYRPARANSPRAGVAVVMLSTEVDEHVELMDRVWCSARACSSASSLATQLSRESLVAAFFGKEVRR